MALASGTRLGPYEIAAQIGVGGMGEVYRATDTTLNRQVAVKVLPESLASDAERIARFEREAKTLASLNHTNIAQVYGFEKSSGVHALVMELVEGPTLADRIAQGAIPVDEALPIAKQIAEALEAAHEQGIIHRDLKPANVKVRPDGTVKVLDFGLAKALEPTGAMSPGMSQAPTITTPAMTQAGMILGTAAYMSPEQAKGKTVDKRSDVWAFGAVLYEMLTGQRAFTGGDVSETLASVLAREPDWTLLPVGMSPVLRTYIRRCLHKDPKQRIGDVQNLRLALEGAFETAAPQMAESVPVSQPVWRRPLPVPASVAVVALLVAGLIAWSLWPTVEVPRVTRLTIVQPDAQPLAVTTTGPTLALSPDGTRAVYGVSVEEGQVALVVRALDALDATVLVPQVRSADPVFSPDGAWVGFSDAADDSIKRVAVTGGPTLTISAIGSPQTRGITWGEDDQIIFGTAAADGLWQVPVGGGTPEPLTTLDEAQREEGHRWPELLPGGAAVLFTIFYQGLDPTTAQIAVLDLVTGEQRVLVSGGSYPKYAPTGHIVYGFQGTLRAVPFDADRLEVTGDPVGVLEGVRTLPTGAADFALAQDGSLVYVPGSGQGVLDRSLVWVDTAGREEPVTTPASAFETVGLSADGTGDPETLMTFEPSTTNVVPGDWSPDGSQLLVAMGEANAGLDVGILSVGDPASWRYLLQTPADERNPTISADGRWLAYGSNETGGYEVYVQRFPEGGGRQQVSVSGGHTPRWSADGQSLTYVRSAPVGLPGAVTRVSVAGGAGESEPLTFGNPVDLFPYTYFAQPGGQWWFDMTPDAERFLMITGGPAFAVQGVQQLIVVQNWFEELRRLVPTD